MLVFWKQRLVYLATPKTGSTAIEAALESLASVVIQRPPELKHTSAHRYWRFLAPYLQLAAEEDFQVVAVMREPLDWLGSWYRYRQRDNGPSPERSTAGITFNDFIEAYLRDPQPEFARVGRQSRFLVPQKGPGVDRIFRYDDMPGFVGFLEDRLDCEINLPRLMVSPPGSLDLDSELESRLREEHQHDFSLYNSLKG
ncbi:sulfotransferase family 2 domain-containing protein [Defluviimonas sp. D31]|uniref:sulfotransferase family 2 domain-containing protein n=1 Tax=Defluviimonas sp. D31 TaxID=3083253 RepID=UPI00296F8AFD|nr:sulfotransferase family 2 domain-containing protein [Defluviimonas sp. D31]MDW4547803.1 sulfotransferase family 2 domain-containing protein [Defluviimonas sp. D31]